MALRHRTILTQNWKYPRALAVTGRRARALASSGGLLPWKFIGSTDSATQHTNRFSRTIEQYYKDTMERGQIHAMLLSSMFGATTYVHFVIWLSQPLSNLRRSFRIS